MRAVLTGLGVAALAAVTAAAQTAPVFEAAPGNSPMGRRPSQVLVIDSITEDPGAN